MQKEKTPTYPASEGFEVLWVTAAVQIRKEGFISDWETTKSRGLQHVKSARIDCSFASRSGNPHVRRDRVDFFWYKASQREMELQESLRIREFEHLQRLKEIELEIEKTKAQSSGKPAQPWPDERQHLHRP